MLDSLVRVSRRVGRSHFTANVLGARERIVFKVLLLIYKVLNGLAPEYLSELVKKRSHLRTLRSSSKNQLNTPRAKTVTYGDRAFSVAGPKLWNNLPQTIRDAPTVNNFKGLLKTYLFKKAYFNE